MRFHPGSERPGSQRRAALAARLASPAFLSKASIAVVLLLALLVLLGWQCHIPLLKRGYPGSPSTMKANTAIGFLLAGLSLWLLQLEARVQTARLKKQLGSLGTSFALGVFLIGLLTVSQYRFGWQLGLDELLFRDVAPSTTTLYPGRMGENTAFNFILVGSALYLLRHTARSSAWLAQSLSYLVYLIALLPLMGHLFGVNPTYEFVTVITTMAAHTAVGFIVLCVGLFLSRPDQGLMQAVTSPLAGGMMARSLLPWSIIIPLGINWFTFQGEHLGWYDADFGYAGRVVAITTAFSSVIWRNARLLNQQEQQKQYFKRQLEASEQELVLANASLERQVAERTAELAQSNDRLHHELLARTLAEQKLQDVATLQRAILDGADYMIIATTVDGIITAFNAAAERSLGYTASEVVGITTPAFLHDPAEVVQYAQELSQTFGRLIEPGFGVFTAKVLHHGIDEHEWTYIRKDGSRFPILLSATALRDLEGQLTGFLGIGIDISDRKRIEAERTQAEVALRQSEEQLQLVLEGSGDGFWDWNIGTGDVYLSARFLEMLGYAADELPQSFSTWESLVHPDDLPWVTELLQAHLADSSVSYSFDYRCLTKAGDWKWIANYGKVVIRDEAGKPLRMTGIHQDIADRKAAEIALQQQTNILQESEARYRSVVDSVAEGIVLQQADGIITACNASAETILGLTAEQLMGLTSVDPRWRAMHEDGSPFLGADHPAMVALRTGQPQSNTLMGVHKPDGSLTWISVNAQPMFHLGDTHTQPYAVAVSFADFTARRQAEEALFRREQEFRTLAENSPDVISRFDRDLRYVYVSPAVELATGMPPHAFVGQTHQALGFPEEHIQLWDTCVQAVFVTGEVDLIDFSFPTPYGLRYYQSRVVPEFGRSGAIETVLVTSRDITETVQAGIELKQLMLELERSNQELQSFAYIASHDLKEPLRTTRNFCSLLQTKCKGSLDERGQDYVDRIQTATQRMQTLIDNLLALSRVTTEAKPVAPVALAQIVAEVISGLSMQCQHTGGTVEVGALPTVRGDATQLAQLFQNLISNALKFHSDAAPVVKIYSRSSPADRTHQILVEDNGVGFEERYCDRIFEPFERLHGRNEFEGTGIGLALCRKIVERHGGSIVAQSGLGLGSRFIVTLPMP